MTSSAVLTGRTEIADEVEMTPLFLLSVSLLQATLLTVTGELDASNTNRLEEHLAENHPDPRLPLVLDLGGLTFMDSKGLNLIVRLHAQAATHGGGLHLAAVQPRPARILDITGVRHVLAIHATVEEALQAAADETRSAPGSPSAGIA
ncbi:STAS domain-containing protein [Nonomuraea typhae]|uniref:STAS domain-containing protein n=1 Tax=Nonomuraea typhae TaxID=2603600 RepID=UPI0012F79F71|nr:STAS domain-containing protein [Nonomuraea typhae]